MAVVGFRETPDSAAAAAGMWQLDARGRQLSFTAIDVPDLEKSQPAVAPRGTGTVALLRTPEPGGGAVGRAVVAFDAAGALDPAFAVAGVRLLGGWAAYDPERAIAGDRRGRVYLGRAERDECPRGKGGGYVLERLAADGRRDGSFRARRVRVGKTRCAAVRPGDVSVDAKGRVTAVAQADQDLHLVRLTAAGHLDRRFGRAGRVRIRANVPDWYLPVLTTGPAGSLYLAATERGRGDDPSATVRWLTRRGRVRGRTVLRPARGFVSTEVAADLAVDRRGRLILAGAMRDSEQLDIREDYGSPSLAVWRLHGAAKRR